jgi:aldehyde dehydrogenase
MLYASPGQSGSKVSFKSRYQNFIGGQWVEPVKGEYFENISPVTGKGFCEIPRSSAEDIEKALDAAHAAADAWGRTSAAERAGRLNRIADRLEANLEMLAVAETWDNGKPVRETLAADMPLAIDHFRYFAGCIRAQEGALSEIDETPSPTISTNRWASSARSSRGISRS